MTTTTKVNTNVTVNYNAGSPTISQPNAVQLNCGDTVTLQLSGFPRQSSINTVSFFANQVVNGVDQKNTDAPAGSWTRAGGNGSTLKVYSCTGQSNGNVVIEDIENQDDDDKYWYGIHIISPGAVWDIDPELINKGKGGG